MDIISWLDTLSFESKYIWVLYVFTIVLLTAVFHFLEGLLFKKLQKKLEKTPTFWDDAFAYAIHKPLGMVIWLVGLTFAAQVAVHWHWHDADQNFILPFIAPIRRVGIVVAIAWFFTRLTTKGEENFIAVSSKKPSKIDAGTAHALGNLIRISILITSGLIILELLHIEIGPILALGGAGTIVLGLASKDLLSNFFGALMVFLDRPFVVGDTIRSPDRQIEGTVEYIGWRLTRIRNYDKRPLYVPNSIFTTVTIENVTRMSNRRIREFVGVRYKDVSQIKDIAEKATQILKDHPQVDDSMTCSVTLHQFGPSSLDLLVFCYTKVTKWADFLPVKQDVMLKLLAIVEECGAECAFPTTTIDLPDVVKVAK
jgi:MscS family membrane protein